MPFPPKAKDIHFDYNTLVKDNVGLTGPDADLLVLTLQ